MDHGNETALIPGSYDPPHLSHIDLIVRSLTGENAPCKAVVAIVHNPTKKERLVSVDNAAALLRRMVPHEFRHRITIAHTKEPAPKLAHKFNATVMIRGRRGHTTLKENAHELLVAAYFKSYQFVTGHPIHMHWIPGPEEHSARSSSRIRRGLLQEQPDAEDIKACLPPAEANILLHAVSQATAPLTTPEGTASFNSALRRMLLPPKMEQVSTIRRHVRWPVAGAPAIGPKS